MDCRMLRAASKTLGKVVYFQRKEANTGKKNEMVEAR